MELKKQGQILSLLLDERLIDHRVVISWVDSIIQVSDDPELWLTEISLAEKEDIDRIVYLFWTHYGYEYSWSFTEYVALLTHRFQDKNLPIHNSIIQLHHLAKDFISNGEDSDSFDYKQKISHLFTILDTDGYSDESVMVIEKEVEKLVDYAQLKHQHSIHFIDVLISQHSHGMAAPHLAFHNYQAKPQ